MTSGAITLRPFRLPNRFGDPVRRALFATTRGVLEKAMAFDELNGIYDRVRSCDDPLHFAENSLAALGVTIDVCQEQLAQLPRQGPLIVVANHPFGGLEGLVLLSLLRRVRPDVKLLANYMLHRIPDLRDAMFFVDPFGRPKWASRNAASIKSAIRWVKQGGVLGVFPAGEVSHLNVRRRRVADPPWVPMIGRLIVRCQADVAPVYFDGRNSDLFQLLGMVHPRMRTVMLPRELLRKKHSRVRVQMGSVVPWSRLAGFANPEHAMAYLRMRTYILKGRTPTAGADLTVRRFNAGEPIASRSPGSAMRRQIETLDSSRRLLASGSMAVYYAAADEIPDVLREIGRVREIAFRAVGEGSGHAVDIDRFDQWYLHLFAWDHESNQVIGAYRMGRTDMILPRYGKDGLYTNTLFHYKSRLLDQINPALELGRSFVHPDYQKNHSSLMHLWKGIGRYVVLHPQYRQLFGPVSISNEYNSVTKQLLISFLRLNRYLPQMARLVRPRQPPHMRPVDDWQPKQASAALRDINDVNDLVRDIEADHKSVPVLLRQYLKLNAKLLGFNIDPEFGDVLDGLMLIDLLDVDRNILFKYMGKPHAQQYLAHHGR